MLGWLRRLLGGAESELFTMHAPGGRCGKLIYRDTRRILEIGWEWGWEGHESLVIGPLEPWMSLSSSEPPGEGRAVLLIAPLPRQWTRPKGLPISEQEEMEVLNKLRNWLKKQHWRSNIDLDSDGQPPKPSPGCRP
jgi:hypothetical protein